MLFGLTGNGDVVCVAQIICDSGENMYGDFRACAEWYVYSVSEGSAENCEYGAVMKNEMRSDWTDSVNGGDVYRLAVGICSAILRGVVCFLNGHMRGM